MVFKSFCKRARSERVLTETGSPAVEFERLAGVEGDELLASVKDDRMVDNRLAIGTGSHQAQRNSPDHNNHVRENQQTQNKVTLTR